MTWLLVLQLSAAAAGYAIPDPVKTPGTVHLMTTAQVCAVKWGLDERRVTEAMRRRVAAAYGIPKAEWPRYKFDHLISRSMGGADVDQNLWFQPTDQARIKDRLEVWFDKAVLPLRGDSLRAGGRRGTDRVAGGSWLCARRATSDARVKALAIYGVKA